MKEIRKVSTFFTNYFDGFDFYISHVKDFALTVVCAFRMAEFEVLGSDYILNNDFITLNEPSLADCIVNHNQITNYLIRILESLLIDFFGVLIISLISVISLLWAALPLALLFMTSTGAIQPGIYIGASEIFNSGTIASSGTIDFNADSISNFGDVIGQNIDLDTDNLNNGYLGVIDAGYQLDIDAENGLNTGVLSAGDGNPSITSEIITSPTPVANTSWSTTSIIAYSSSIAKTYFSKVLIVIMIFNK